MKKLRISIISCLTVLICLVVILVEFRKQQALRNSTALENLQNNLISKVYSFAVLNSSTSRTYWLDKDNAPLATAKKLGEQMAAKLKHEFEKGITIDRDCEPIQIELDEAMLFVTVFPKDIALYEQSQRYSKLLAIPTNHHQLWQTLARIIPKKALPMIRRTVKNTAENAIPNCANDYSWILVNKSVIAGVTQSLEPNDVKDMLISDLYNIDQKQLSSKTLEKLSINVAHQELREYIKVYRAWATEAEANNAIGLFEVKLQEEGKEDIRKRLCRGARTGVDSLLKQIFNKPREEPLNDLALKEKRDSVHEQLCFAVFNALETGRFDKTKYVIDTGHMKKPVDLTEIFNEFISCRQAASLLSISFGRRELDHYKIHFTMGLNNISEHVIKHNT